ncbi:MAG: hypothetical protein DRI57_19340 [Deltaproteobacteria bacterium]|nr:MAG: hypothetical protein DRI57_19340 [Deltaproteobacteria bacterium]
MKIRNQCQLTKFLAKVRAFYFEKCPETGGRIYKLLYQGILVWILFTRLEVCTYNDSDIFYPPSYFPCRNAV